MISSCFMQVTCSLLYVGDTISNLTLHITIHDARTTAELMDPAYILLEKPLAEWICRYDLLKEHIPQLRDLSSGDDMTVRQSLTAFHDMVSRKNVPRWTGPKGAKTETLLEDPQRNISR